MEDTNGNQSSFISDLDKSTKRLTDGANSCTTTQISSSNYSDAKTSIVYEYDESIEIKEEITEDQARHEGGEYNHLYRKRGLDEVAFFSDNKAAVKTDIVYEYDENSEIKEIVQDSEAFTGQKLNPKYESRSNPVDIGKADTLATKKLRLHKKKKVRESEAKPEKKYNCHKCARSYKRLSTLNSHQKFECGVTAQFICEFCDKRFKHKSNISRHVGQVHQKIKSNQNKEKIQESKQEAEKNHNMYRHQKTNSNISRTSYNCDICFRSYISSRGLYDHNRLKHSAVKPEFICDFCCYKTNMKSALSLHISSRHFKNMKKTQARHNCYKCNLNYISLGVLKQHERLKHAAVKPEFTCDVCGYKTDRKSTLTSHISSRHFKISKKLRAVHN